MDAGPCDGFAENAGVKLEPIDEDVKGGFSGKRERHFGSDPFSESEERNIRQKLDVGLSRNETMQRPGPGGCRLTYIEGWKVIHDANQIFGFNGWSSRVVTLDLRYLDESNNRFSACVCATVRITLRDGSYREDRGGGASDNMRSKGDAILKAEKEAVTDATKRALKNFGLRLGLSLYDRQHVREMNKPQPRAQARQMNAAPASGVHTPQASRAAPGSSHRMTPQGLGVSPVSPGSAKFGAAVAGGMTGANCMGNANDAKGQFAAQRELAVKRKQAFLQAKAAEEKASMQKGNAHGEVSVQNATSGNGFPPHGQKNACGAALGIAGPAAQPGAAQIGNAFSAGCASPQGIQRPGSSTGVAGFNMSGQGPAKRGAARPPSSDSDSSRGCGSSGGVGQAYGGQRRGAASGVCGTTGPARQGRNSTVDMAKRQQEIDELSRMALADF